MNLNTKFVLLDEPYSGIEPLYREKIKELIVDSKREKGFIITDHDYTNIIETSDKLMLLVNGVLKQIDNLEELEDWNYVPVETFS